MERLKSIFGEERLSFDELSARLQEQGAAYIGAEALTAANDRIAGLEETVTRLQQEHMTALTGAKIGYAIDLAITKARARDIEAVRPFIDRSAVTVEGDEVFGAEEQVAAVKAAKGYLFEGSGEERWSSGMRQIGRGSVGGSANEALRAALGKA